MRRALYRLWGKRELLLRGTLAQRHITRGDAASAVCLMEAKISLGDAPHKGANASPNYGKQLLFHVKMFGTHEAVVNSGVKWGGVVLAGAVGTGFPIPRACDNDVSIVTEPFLGKQFKGNRSSKAQEKAAMGLTERGGRLSGGRLAQDIQLCQEARRQHVRLSPHQCGSQLSVKLASCSSPPGAVRCWDASLSQGNNPDSVSTVSKEHR